MSEIAGQRRLAAVLVADVVGYSRLMEADEAGTLAVLKERRKGTVEPLVREHRGRIVKVMGDGVLVEFASAVNALACALALQKAMVETNAGLAADRRIELRIGINMGDLIGEGSDIYGDGVNIAARLEALAEPGGICVSGKLHDEVAGKLAFAAKDLGEVALKNIARPVQAYRIAEALSTNGGTSISTRASSRPDKPSIAVLPFVNMSGDSEQEYFSDGITEDIITDLSQISALFVAARNTAFTFKGRAVEVTEAARKLNVGYVLEGSVRKAGNRIRITVQLIDGATGGHLWAERYDRDFGDIFALQDDISKNVVSALSVKLLPEEFQTITARSTKNAEAYNRYLLARATLHLTWCSKSDLRTARRLFSEAAAIDPGYARAYAGIADCDSFLWVNGDSDISYDKMLANSSKAMELAPNLAEAHVSKALALYLTGHSAEARSMFERAIALDPELFGAYFFYGFSCRDTGHFEEAVPLLERAAALSPNDPMSPCLLTDLYKALGDLKQSEAAARRTLDRVEAILEQHPGAADIIAIGAATMVYLGENARAEEWANRAVSLASESYVVRYNAACTYAVIGKPEAALECLEHIFSHMPRVRGWLLGIMNHDTQFESLRGRSDFQTFVRRLEAAVTAQS
jgi:adenylate cyclase